MGAVNSKMHRANLQTCSSWEVWKDDSPLSGQQTAPRSFAVTSQERNILRASCGSSKPQYLDMASWGEAGAWRAGRLVAALFIWETHHKACASLRAGQLAGARNLAHHQSLKLLQLLQESSANTTNQNHEGRLRERTLVSDLCPGLQGGSCGFVSESEHSTKKKVPLMKTQTPLSFSTGLAELMGLRICPHEQLVHSMLF